MTVSHLLSCQSLNNSPALLTLQNLTCYFTEKIEVIHRKCIPPSKNKRHSCLPFYRGAASVSLEDSSPPRTLHLIPYHLLEDFHPFNHLRSLLNHTFLIYTGQVLQNATWCNISQHKQRNLKKGKATFPFYYTPLFFCFLLKQNFPKECKILSCSICQSHSVALDNQVCILTNLLKPPYPVTENLYLAWSQCLIISLT